MSRLLSAGANAKWTDSDGKTPIRLACEAGHVACVHWLKSTSSVNIKDHHGMAPVHAACARNDAGMVSELLSGGDVDLGVCDWKGRSALFLASELGHTQIVSQLVMAGADVNQCDGEKQTSLYVACDKGHSSVVEFLLASNANVAAVTTANRFALVTAAHQGFDTIVSLLIAHGAPIDMDCGKGTPLVHACMGGHTSVVQLLLNAGADASSSNAIHTAASLGHAAIVDALLAAGADADSCWDGVSVLYAALTAPVVKRLIDAGASVNCCHPKNGRTALGIAAERGDLEVCKALLAGGADAHLDKPQEWARKKGFADIVRLFQADEDSGVARFVKDVAKVIEMRRKGFMTDDEYLTAIFKPLGTLASTTKDAPHTLERIQQLKDAGHIPDPAWSAFRMTIVSRMSGTQTAASSKTENYVLE